MTAAWRRNQDLNLRSFVVFLCVCQHEGIRMKELAYACGTSEASASRCVRALCLPSGRRAEVRHRGLLRVFQSPKDGRSRLVFLTEDGEQLRNEIEHIFAAAH